MRAAQALMLAALALPACVPSMRHLVERHRYADAICFASDDDEARAVSEAVWQTVEPKVHVHVVSRQEWNSLLGEEQGGRADAGYMAIRTAWVSNAISVRAAELSVGLWAPRLSGEDLERVDAASHEQRSIAAAATGERVPSQRTSTVTHSWTPAPPRDPLGAILSLFAPTSSTTQVVLDPEDREYAQAGPAAYALMSALNDGDDSAGFVLRQEDRRRAEVRVELHLEDDLEDSGRCTLRISKTFALQPDDPSFRQRVEAQFRREYRSVPSLHGTTTAWLSNPTGSWRLTLER